MKYTPGQIAKAIFAFAAAFLASATASAHGLDLSTLGVGDWMLAAGAGLTGGGGVFALPNKPTEPALSPAEQVVTSVQAVLADNAASTAALSQVRDAIGSVVGAVPGFGPLAQQVINQIPMPFQPPQAYTQAYNPIVAPYDR